MNPTVSIGPETTQPITIGQVIGQRTIRVGRQDLVRYAAASGDFNPIHYSPEAASAAGLPGVIAHGMWTMGAAIDLVSAWVGDPGRIISYQVRFARPVLVNWPGPTELHVRAEVSALDEATNRATVNLTVTSGGARILTKAQAVVQTGPVG